MGAGAATIASAGAAIGIGNVLSSSIHSVARNPSLAKQLFGYAILGFALTEAIASFAPMMAFLISFVFQVPSLWFPGIVPDLAGLGDNVVMRPLTLGEEEVPKPTKDRKMRRAWPSDTPKPRKSRAQKLKTDPAVLSADIVQMLLDEDEEGEDVDCLLVARKRGGIEASRTAELVTLEEVQPQTEVISEEGSSRVPESSSVDDASYHDEQPAGVPEGSSSEALQREDNAPSDSLGGINIDESPPGPTFLRGGFGMPGYGAPSRIVLQISS
nr:uncharacterized protein LOC104092331 [Nicotiana tomentosiformis]